MAVAQDHIKASRTEEFGKAEKARNDKRHEGSTKEDLIPPFIRYPQSSSYSDNGSIVGVYSLKLTSATSSVESFRTASTSLQEGENKGENGDEDTRSEESSICEGQYANQPMEATLDASWVVVEDGPLPRLGLDLPPTEVQTSESRSQSSMTNPTKDTEPSNRIHRIHRCITKNISRKLIKRKEH
ncbi:hypothetical protein CDV36_006547 [Fusarium kuroshium]|uniref:Uncharacterized protein n=1 Tax=Fusarium kuroshium TaxID=2010991 RepID=A0A3M2S895_9HYPO|nr:hypothetical protein CDV36_006547 [Fusarium kuroshium]